MKHVSEASKDKYRIHCITNNCPERDPPHRHPQKNDPTYRHPRKNDILFLSAIIALTICCVFVSSLKASLSVREFLRCNCCKLSSEHGELICSLCIAGLYKGNRKTLRLRGGLGGVVEM